MIIATAGHIDHGKTTLLQALTGKDTTHLPEEKRRGLTIDLGYAYLPLDNGQVIGFIDVPGHEKFLTNMLAGVNGIQHALLVIACDDGVMAQTREHLAILTLLGIPSLTVVLTKADKVSRQEIEQVIQQIKQLLPEFGYPDAPLFITSAPVGDGIPELKQHLISLSPSLFQPNHRFRLAIDRIFTLKGAGLVVTGTALSGEVKIGDTLWLTGAECPVRVRSIHSQNCAADYAHANQRIALNITADIDKHQLSRGDWLLSDPPPPPTERVVVLLNSVSSLQHWQPLHIHHAASHVTGRLSLLENQRIAPYQQQLAELILDTPLYLTIGDQLILRDISAKQTLAGSKVLHLTPPIRGKRRPEYLDWLNELAHSHTEQQIIALYLSRGAMTLDSLGWMRQLTKQGLTEQLSPFNLITAGHYILEQTIADCYQQQLLDALAQEHEQHPDQAGVGRERLRRMALPTAPSPLVFKLIELLLQQGVMCNHSGWLHLSTHRLMFDETQQKLWQKIAPYFQQESWWVRDLASELQIDEKTMRDLLRKAAQLGHITAIVRDRYFATHQIHHFANLIRNLQQQQGNVSAACFRDQAAIGRKLAIQLLEFFDRSGFTQRKGELHILRDQNLFKM